MAQYCALLKLQSRLFSSTWAQTQELIEKGGRAVEGLEIGAIYNPQNTSPAYLKFTGELQERYHRPPSLASSHAYETVLVLAHALTQTGGKAQGLADALTNIRGFEGLQSTISFDAYGDVQREVYIAKVVNGNFQIIATIPPQPEMQP